MMIEVRKTNEFQSWFLSLRDINAQMRIATRIDRLEHGNFGDVKPVGAGVSELRIDYGPGYRLYIKQKGKTLVILLAGGDKRAQAADIKLAKELAERL